LDQYTAWHCNRTILRVDLTRIREDSTLGWFTETHFVEFLCYPSKIIIIKVQITTVKSFGPIGDDLDIGIVLQSFHSQITGV
jgi:hypothetical protein